MPRKHVLLVKSGEFPQQRYTTIEIGPGEVFELDDEIGKMLEKTPAFRSGEIKRGRFMIMSPR